MTIYFYFKSGEVRLFEGEEAKAAYPLIHNFLCSETEEHWGRFRSLVIKKDNHEYFILFSQVEMIEVVNDKNDQ